MDNKQRLQRAAHIVREEQDKAEILVCAIHFAIMLSVYLIYLIAPKGFDESIAFKPVPIIMGIYLPFLFLRLVLSLKKRLRGLFLDLMIVCDAVALIALICSFHIQYEQPLAFDLKSPTFIYYFIFIALSCLRYNLRQVIIAGLSAIAAWTWLLLVVVSNSQSTVTNNYIDYFKANHVLLGAEFDKILVLVIVTFILSLSVYRSRRLLTKFVMKDHESNDLSQFVGQEASRVIQQFDGQFTPGRGEVREAATVMVDIRNFTEISTHLPCDNLMRVLSLYQQEVATIIFKHGGIVDKYMGDGILAHFGALTEDSCYAANALRALEEICGKLRSPTTMNRLNEMLGEYEFDFGVTCAIGAVNVGIVGIHGKLELTVIGEAVNFAAKLEKHTKKIQATSIATIKSFDTALKQGFEPKSQWKLSNADSVAGIDHTVDLMVIYQQQISDENISHLPSALLQTVS